MAYETDARQRSAKNSSEVDPSLVRSLTVLQTMIDFSIERLNGLRTACSTSEKLTQSELRHLEHKFIRMFAEFVVTKKKLPKTDQLPPMGILRDWLNAVGLSSASVNVVMDQVNSVEELLEKTDSEIVAIVKKSPTARDVEWQRVQRANLNLRLCRDMFAGGEIIPADGLHWNSWDRHHNTLYPRAISSPTANQVKPIQEMSKSTSNFLDIDKASALAIRRQTICLTNTNSSRFTPSPSPPGSPSTLLSGRPDKPGLPRTPPSNTKKQIKSNVSPMHSVYLSKSSTTISTPTRKNGSHLDVTKSPENPSLKFLDHAQSSHQINQVDNNIAHRNCDKSSEHLNDISASSDHNTLHVPRSPVTSKRSFHRNPPGAPNPAESSYQAPLHGHRLNKKFKVIATCDQCNKQMFLGLKCKECKFRCHKDCEPMVRSTCDEFRRHLADRSPQSGSPQQSSSRNTSPSGRANGSYLSGRSMSGFGAESAGSADSSCNSSTPSSPAVFTSQQTTPVSIATVSPRTHFNFPEVSHPSIYKPANMGNLTLETHMKRQEQPPSPRFKANPPEVVVIESSNYLAPPVASLRKDNALLNDTPLDITLSEDSSPKDSPCSTIRVDAATDDPNDVQWTRQNSISLKEWDIPFEDINLVEKIGDGRFGTVHKAQWHGAVAVKILKEDYLDTEAFRMEVATFKKTRHENVVLFMGACIKPQAIVTALCKGHTLYTHLHVRRAKFTMGKATIVAHQIARGMGYLHDRNITHKDLKSKNIFLDNGKVVITDFALFSATKLDYDERLGLCIPSEWLGYLAPEIMRRLPPCPPDHRDQLPLSQKSDIYAFGTIWYELLCNDLPFSGKGAETTIFQVGRGMKQSLANLHASRNVKDLLMKCWAYDLGLRPDFAVICRQLDMLPKKQLTRSPSHPVHMSRSAESVF